MSKINAAANNRCRSNFHEEKPMTIPIHFTYQKGWYIIQELYLRAYPYHISAVEPFQGLTKATIVFD